MLDHLHQKWPFMREPCKFLDHLHHPRPKGRGGQVVAKGALEVEMEKGAMKGLEEENGAGAGADGRKCG